MESTHLADRLAAQDAALRDKAAECLKVHTAAANLKDKLTSASDEKAQIDHVAASLHAEVSSLQLRLDESAAAAAEGAEHAEKLAQQLSAVHAERAAVGGELHAAEERSEAERQSFASQREALQVWFSSFCRL